MDIVIKHGDISELGSISEIEKICFTDPWSEKMFEPFFDSQTCKTAVAQSEDKICGYICYYIVGGEANDICGDCELANIAVLPEYRGRDIARKLMAYMYEEAKSEYCSDIFLEVRESNISAIGLYTRENFEIYGKRKNYYTSPREDAVLMKKRLQ
ncbi:MAG: ribosomal-protein-alanine N-acetyltransferase [Ruminococcaceae bacterium]|nr:ribosomal-protein-alanine N-acetyltransferase [Oscillospiraceae bacterium]